MVKYGLMLDGQLVKCNRDDNSRHSYCVSESVTLIEHGYEDWIVEDLATVLRVLNPGYINPGWFNADVDNPIVALDLSAAQPVRIETTVKYTVLSKE